MVQSDKENDICGFEQAASSMYQILDPIQNNVQYNAGGIGIYSGVGIHTPGEVIDVSSSIVGGGRDNILTKCIPPSSSRENFNSNSAISHQKIEIQGLSNPSVDDNNNINGLENNYEGLIKADGTIQPKILDKTGFLQPETTNFKRSATDYSAVDWQAGFSGNSGNLYTHPQNLTYVIERSWLERGGLDQNQMIKKSQEYYVPNTGKGPLGLGEQICEKIRQPYNIKYPFGLPTNLQGEPISSKQSQHFNAYDVTALGGSSPLLNQNNQLPFNYNAMYSNGGCNYISYFKNNRVCSNND